MIEPKESNITFKYVKQRFIERVKNFRPIDSDKQETIKFLKECQQDWNELHRDFPITDEELFGKEEEK